MNNRAPPRLTKSSKKTTEHYYSCTIINPQKFPPVNSTPPHSRLSTFRPRGYCREMVLDLRCEINSNAKPPINWAGGAAKQRICARHISRFQAPHPNHCDSNSERSGDGFWPRPWSFSLVLALIGFSLPYSPSSKSYPRMILTAHAFAPPATSENLRPWAAVAAHPRSVPTRPAVPKDSHSQALPHRRQNRRSPAETEGRVGLWMGEPSVRERWGGRAGGHLASLGRSFRNQQDDLWPYQQIINDTSKPRGQARGADDMIDARRSQPSTALSIASPSSPSGPGLANVTLTGLCNTSRALHCV